MTEWNGRSLESQALFNPAFCGLILHYGIRAYEKGTGTGLPFSLSPIVLTFALSERLRRTLPRTTRTRFPVWARATPELRVQLGGRVRAVVPLAREGMLFLMQHGAVQISKDARVKSVSRRLRGTSAYSESNEDVAECMEGSRLIAGLFGQIDEEETIFMTLGLTV